MSLRSLLSIAIPVLVLSYGSRGWSSGGWVGNSRMQIASNSSNSFRLPPSSSRPTETSEWNSLLLPKGTSRLLFEWGQIQPRIDGTQYYFNFAYQYAFTEKLTTNTLLDWGYSLLAGNGQGHELAAYFGLYGLGYSSSVGLITAPGVGLGYAFTEGPWRYQTRVLAINTYYAKFHEWGRFRIQWDSELSYSVNEKWWLALAAKTNFIKEDDELAFFRTRHDGAFLRPQARIGYNAENIGVNNDRDLEFWVGIGLDNVSNSSLGIGWRW